MSCCTNESMCMACQTSGGEACEKAAPVPILTLAQATAAVYRELAAEVRARAAADIPVLERRAIEGLVPTPESNNLALATSARLKLSDSLLATAKMLDKADRPRILQPERSVKPFRGVVS